MPDYIAKTYKPGNLPDYTPSMSGNHPERFHDEKSLMTFLRKCVEQGILIPQEPCESFSPETNLHCHNPKGHKGAHEAYRAYGYGVFHTASWSTRIGE